MSPNKRCRYNHCYICCLLTTTHLGLGTQLCHLHLISIKLCFFLGNAVQGISLLLCSFNNGRSSAEFNSFLSYSSEPLLMLMKLCHFTQSSGYCQLIKYVKQQSLSSTFLRSSVLHHLYHGNVFWIIEAPKPVCNTSAG